MLRLFANRVGSQLPPTSIVPQIIIRQKSSTTHSTAKKYMTPQIVHPVSAEDLPFFHHRKGPRFTDHVKFKSPRKRASKLLHELQQEAIEKSKASKPAVFDVHHSPGDAIELQIIEEGGVDAKPVKVRGLVIGKYNKGLDTSVLIRDVVMGIVVERRLPLHSPLVKSIRMIEKNFLYKGRRKVKRAKLYFLRDRNENESRVTKGKS